MNTTTKRRLLWLTALGLLLAINASAWLHAGAMTRWADGGARTPRPEDLGWARRALVLFTGIRIPRPTNHLTPRDVGLDFETHLLDNGRGEQLEAWYVPVVSATTVTVLLHGYAGQKDGLLGLAQGLTRLGSSVLLVDFYGSGGSSGSGTSLGVHEAHDVAAAVAHCRSRWPGRAILLYGQSMGGAAALRAVAELGVEPDALVLEATFDRLLSTVASRFHRIGLPATPLAHLLVLWGSVRIGANGFAHDPVDYARQVRCPTLILQGDSDPNISTEEARSIHAALGGPKRYSEYAKARHEDIRTADPERWEKDVRELLDGIDRAR